MQYFQKFWSDNIAENLDTQKNIYSVQKSGKCIDTNAQKISLPSYELYWSKDLGVDCVADVMSLKRYELIIRYLHANYNTEKKDDSSRLFKVEPVVLALPIHQYLQKKIHKWGFKNFVRAGASRIIYYVHAGQKSAGWEKCGAFEVVFWLLEELPKNQNLQLFMDNWFFTLPPFNCHLSLKSPWRMPIDVWKGFEKMELWFVRLSDGLQYQCTFDAMVWQQICCCCVKFYRSRMHQHSPKIQLGTKKEDQDRLSWHGLTV